MSEMGLSESPNRSGSGCQLPVSTQPPPNSSYQPASICQYSNSKPASSRSWMPSTWFSFVAVSIMPVVVAVFICVMVDSGSPSGCGSTKLYTKSRHIFWLRIMSFSQNSSVISGARSFSPGSR